MLDVFCRFVGDCLTRIPIETPVVGDLSSEKTRRADLLLLDSSGSMSDSDYHPSRLAGALQASKGFIEEKRRGEPTGYVGVASYSFLGQELLPIKRVGEIADSEIEALNQLAAHGGTNQDAGLLKCWEMLRHAGASQGSRIVVLTDGWASLGNNPVVIAKELKDKGVQLDIVGIGGSPSDVNEEQLRSMASEVDGKVRYWFIDSAPKLVEHYRKLSLLAVR